jgi:hypothetical protein
MTSGVTWQFCGLFRVAVECVAREFSARQCRALFRFRLRFSVECVSCESVAEDVGKLRSFGGGPGTDGGADRV